MLNITLTALTAPLVARLRTIGTPSDGWTSGGAWNSAEVLAIYSETGSTPDVLASLGWISEDVNDETVSTMCSVLEAILLAA